MASDRERDRLLQQAKRMDLQVRRGASKDEIREAILQRDRENFDAVLNTGRRDQS